VHGDTIIYASAAGVVRKRVLSTGALLAEKLLDGGVIMAPPASVGDTIVFTYEDAGACAMLISSLRTLWCRTFARGTLLEMGHAAASIDNGLVFMTGLVDLRGVSVSEFLGLPGSLRRRLAWSFVKSTDIPAGQRVQALRLSDGSLVWRTHVFPNLREVTGHAAGTAVLEGKVGAIVLPLADSIAGFDSGTGRILWTAGARGSRGPPFLRSGQVVLAGHDGVIEVRDALTGKLQCQHRRAVGYDRAGPAQAGNLLLFADLHGGVEAIPANRLLACSASDRS
jgi:outer membrane protein assembly factor BamB